MFFLVGGFYGDLGGATPGKHLVGLSVLAADSVEVIDNNILEGEKVRILPGENPGWWRCVCSFIHFFIHLFIHSFNILHKRLVLNKNICG